MPQVNVGVHPSNCVITKLKLDKDRKKILERKDRTTLSEKKVRSRPPRPPARSPNGWSCHAFTSARPLSIGHFRLVPRKQHV
jgi:hypothetical protein